MKINSEFKFFAHYLFIGPSLEHTLIVLFILYLKNKLYIYFRNKINAEFFIDTLQNTIENVFKRNFYVKTFTD